MWHGLVRRAMTGAHGAFVPGARLYEQAPNKHDPLPSIASPIEEKS
jgi:hypothetical protein